MLLDFGYVLLGLALLVTGGEALVRGATGIALRLKVSPAVIGLTVVAAGTSMPELVVSVQSALAESPGLAAGNVVGSNIFNIGLILGLTALIRPLQIRGASVRLEWPVMMLASFQFYLLARDGILDRMEGGFFLLGMVTFTGYAIWLARQATTEEERREFDESTSLGIFQRNEAWIHYGAVAVGVALLAGGSSLLVSGASDLAAGFGVTETVIGLTVVAAGTSAPELFASVIAARRGQADIAVANIIGSNIFNILAILGTTGLVHPLEVPTEIITRDLWWMLGAALILFPLMKSSMRINRVEGAILLCGFLLYMFFLLP